MSYPSPTRNDLTVLQKIAIDRAIHTLEQEASDAWGREAAARRDAPNPFRSPGERAYLEANADSHKRHAEELRSVADELSTYFPKGDEK